MEYPLAHTFGNPQRRRQALPVRLSEPEALPSSRRHPRRLTAAQAPKPLARGRYVFGPAGPELRLEGAATSAEAQRAGAAHSALGLALLQSCATTPFVGEALRALDGLAVELVSGAERFIELDPARSVVMLDAELVRQLRIEAGSGGLTAPAAAGADVPGGPVAIESFGVLSAYAHLFVAACRGGADERQALHRVLDFHILLNTRRPAAVAALHTLLRSSLIDASGAFDLFLQSATDGRLALEVDGLAIAAQLQRPLGELEAEARAATGGTGAALEAAIKWRDKWVTWILGQDLVDLPYDQRRIFSLLEEREGEDIDAKRRLVHQELAATYDRRLEGRNIERLSAEIETEGRMIVCGRISRAFGNQTQLLSAATYVERAGLDPLCTRLEAETADLPELGPQVARVTKLVRQASPVSYAQLKGALWHLEEALRELQSERTRRLNAAREADSERLAGRKGFAHFREALSAISRQLSGLFVLTTELREKLEGSPRRSAAFLILQQRFFPGETQLLALANANRDTHPGKIEALRDLTRKGGHNRYASEGYGIVDGPDGATRQVSWISKCQHWIEAIPMFIKERIVKVPVTSGGEVTFVERIETEVDQRGMEAFFRYAAEFWAENCREVADTEHVAVAREWLARQAVAGRAEALDEDGIVALLRELGLLPHVGAVAALVAASADALLDRIGTTMERENRPRFETLRLVLLGLDASSAVEGNALRLVADGNAAARLADERGLSAEAARLAHLSERWRRPLSTLHVLTTESAGMTEGYVQTWLETEMALANVIRTHGWEAEVRQRLDNRRQRMATLAEKAVAELGMEALVQEAMSENGMPRAAAVGLILATHRPVADEVSRLAVLIEEDEREERRSVDWTNVDDPPSVGELIVAQRERLVALALPKVVEANGRAIQQQIEALVAERSLSVDAATSLAIEQDPDFAADLEFFVRSLARQERVEALDREFPERNILKTQADYVRNHTQLALSMARRAVIAAHGAQALTEDPRYNFRAVGGKKRYNLLYTPSRVDLGAEEMDSIVRWNQWVGGADQAACNAGRDFYSLINEAGVEVRPALAWQEIQKTSENANMTAGKAFANAVALLINSVDEGDQQLMADQMALRHDPDRGTPAASEGYGGYCVPKDGLFLAFVLGLRNETKLRQMGVPAAMHAAVMALAREAILHYGDFETDFAWQRWVGEKLLAPDKLRQCLADYVGLRHQRDEDVLVFNISKIAEAIQHLGQPWHEVTAGPRLFANLAAQWAVGKMIIGAEQVQRFMVFYKAWLIARALSEAGRAGTGRVVTPAEYKTVQDIRYSGGIRIFEILAQTGEHLTYSLDEEGQDLVLLMTQGYTPLAALESEAVQIERLPAGSEERQRRQKLLDRRRRLARRIHETYGFDAARQPEIEKQLAAKFPRLAPPSDIRLVSTTMASTQDVFYYTDDTQLTQIADRAQQALGDLGLGEEQMRANAEVYGGRLAEWTVIRELPPATREVLLRSVLLYRVGADTFEVPLTGAIHALVLRLLGPARSYEAAVQGADVVNTSIAFKELAGLIDDPPRLIALMLEGNPQSALALTDGISGRGSRMLTYRDIMLFFATCDALAGAGRGSYRAIGLGDHVVARLRAEMGAKRQRAADLATALDAVDRADNPQILKTALAEARRHWRRILDEIRAADEALEAVTEEERTRRYKRNKPQDRIVTQALARLASAPDLSTLDFGTWLALGGSYVVAGEGRERIAERRRRLEGALARLVPAAGASTAHAAWIDAAVRVLARPRFVPEVAEFEQVLGRESSSKAVHASEAEARERRRALRARQLRIETFTHRELGFREAATEVEGLDLVTAHTRGLAELDAFLNLVRELVSTPAGQRAGQRALVNRRVGRFLAFARRGLTAAVEELMPAADQAGRATFLRDIAALYGGREIVFEAWKRIAGGYQDLGDIPRLVLALGDDAAALERLTRAIELFYVTLALGQTVEHLQSEPSEIQWVRFWDDVAVFFAETLNDHDCLYLPWNYVRGVEHGRGFDRLGEERLYALAVERHAWLYRYMRLLLTELTELRELPAAERDALLGNVADGRVEAGIGADGRSDVERAWRAYNQLREAAFWRNDGFPIPVVFPTFDPALISAERRVNMVFLFPVGRTHISRAFREGPTLSRALEAEGRPGANIIVTRHGTFAPEDGAKRPTCRITSGHLYVSRDELVAALVRERGLDASAAEARANALTESGALTPKGIRIAARFTRPLRASVLVPYHGNAAYTSGALEDNGLPYTVQSLIHTDITYDKSLYPEVYRASGVEMPPEIDWLMAYQEGLSREEALRQIVDGREGFEGLRRLAERHPIILIKGAAESGARNLKVFDVGRGQGTWNEPELLAAALFVYERAVKQNMVIQEAARTTPEFWASAEYLRHFVDRQIVEWNTAVQRDRYPRSTIYGSLRIIASSSAPGRPYDLTHLIALSSLQVATNVGRGGTLEPLRPEFIQPEHRQAILSGLAGQVPLVMQALDRYAASYATTFEKHRGRPAGQDLRGVSYGWPGYLMLDYLVTPVFEREGRVADIEPIYDAQGTRIGSRIVLEDGQGRFEAKINGWRFIHLEPNVGIGLWDRFNLREEHWEGRDAARDGRPFNWDAVGHDDRIVLRNFALAGEDYLRANLGEGWPKR